MQTDSDQVTHSKHVQTLYANIIQKNAASSSTFLPNLFPKKVSTKPVSQPTPVEQCAILERKIEELKAEREKYRSEFQETQRNKLGLDDETSWRDILRILPSETKLEYNRHLQNLGVRIAQYGAKLKTLESSLGITREKPSKPTVVEQCVILEKKIEELKSERKKYRSEFQEIQKNKLGLGDETSSRAILRVSPAATRQEYGRHMASLTVRIAQHGKELKDLESALGITGEKPQVDKPILAERCAVLEKKIEELKAEKESHLSEFQIYINRLGSRQAVPAERALEHNRLMKNWQGSISYCTKELENLKKIRDLDSQSTMSTTQTEDVEAINESRSARPRKKRLADDELVNDKQKVRVLNPDAQPQSDPTDSSSATDGGKIADQDPNTVAFNELSFLSQISFEVLLGDPPPTL